VRLVVVAVAVAVAVAVPDLGLAHHLLVMLLALRGGKFGGEGGGIGGRMGRIDGPLFQGR